MENTTNAAKGVVTGYDSGWRYKLVKSAGGQYNFTT